MADEEIPRGSFTHIGNKNKRKAEYRKYRAGKAKDKLSRRKLQAKEEKDGDAGKEKKRARLAANKTRTIENTRVFNPTIISEPNTHGGLKPSQGVLEAQGQQQQAESSRAAAKRAEEEEEEQQRLASKKKSKDDEDSTGLMLNDDDEDGEQEAVVKGDEDDQDEEEDEEQLRAEQEAYEDATAPPAILITTSAPSSSTSPHLASVNARSHPAERTRDFIDELLNMFPGGEYRPRAKAKGASLGKISEWARKRGYNAMIVIGEDHKVPTSMTIVSLPEGPTAVFRLTSISLGKEITGHARATPHTPELILNNFTTTLGHEVGGLLQSLFPSIPQLEGRQALSAHNQRDFIFFRRHRYEFTLRKGEEKARLQEIGPRFTVKLRKLIQGLPKGAGGWDGLIAFDGEEAESAAKMNMGGEGEDAAVAAVPKKEKRRRGQVEEATTSFEWKPKMGVSRRNFYL